MSDKILSAGTCRENYFNTLKYGSLIRQRRSFASVKRDHFEPATEMNFILPDEGNFNRFIQKRLTAGRYR